MGLVACPFDRLQVTGRAIATFGKAAERPGSTCQGEGPPMPRFRVSIAGVCFWVALVAANCFFFVEFTRINKVSMVLGAMILAIPVINLLVIGLRGLLFGPARRQAFWRGFEATAALGFLALLIAAYWTHTDLLEEIGTYFESMMRGLLRWKFANYFHGLFIGLIFICVLSLAVCLPILVPAILIGIVNNRRARKSAAIVPTTAEEVPVPC